MTTKTTKKIEAEEGQIAVRACAGLAWYFALEGLNATWNPSAKKIVNSGWSHVGIMPLYLHRGDKSTQKEEMVAWLCL